MADAINTPVLVVDDEPAIRLLLADVLEEEGYEVTTVSDGAYAGTLRPRTSRRRSSSTSICRSWTGGAASGPCAIME